VVFTNGGSYQWVLQDSATSDGFSQLHITGNLDLSTISTSFLLSLASVDLLGNQGYADLTLGHTYMLPFVQTTGHISGFDPALFSIDASNFAGGVMANSLFSVSMDANDQILYLNFTTVPEPSTYALMTLGLGLVVLPILRRRRG
jgi:hypothetical protein